MIAWMGMAIPNSMTRNDPVPGGEGERNDHQDGAHGQNHAVAEVRPYPRALKDGRVRRQGEPTGRQPGTGRKVLIGCAETDEHHVIDGRHHEHQPDRREDEGHEARNLRPAPDTAQSRPARPCSRKGPATAASPVGSHHGSRYHMPS
jgi:hypothetical protein